MKNIFKRIYNLLTYFNPKIETEFKTIHVGTRYGGYDIYSNSLESPVIISCGLGEDASFDVDMINRYNAKVIAIDPTPRSIKYYNSLKMRFGKKGAGNYDESGNLVISFYDLSLVNELNFLFENKAIWKVSDENLKLFYPINKEHISLSINKKKTNQNYFVAQTISIEDIYKKYNLEEVDILKLDVEGAELQIIESMLQKKIYPKQLLIEFDIRRTKSIKNKIILSKLHNKILVYYSLIHINTKGDFTYIRKDISLA